MVSPRESFFAVEGTGNRDAFALGAACAAVALECCAAVGPGPHRPAATLSSTQEQSKAPRKAMASPTVEKHKRPPHDEITFTPPDNGYVGEFYTSHASHSRRAILARPCNHRALLVPSSPESSPLMRCDGTAGAASLAILFRTAYSVLQTR